MGVRRKGWMREQVCAQLPELWLCATATRARWFFGHPSLLDTPEVKSVPEPADSEQATASSVSVSGNLGESHMDGTKASELIPNDRPSIIVNQEEPCQNMAKAADSSGVLINSTSLEGYSEGVHTVGHTSGVQFFLFQRTLVSVLTFQTYLEVLWVGV